MRALTEEQYAKKKFRAHQASLSYPKKVRQVVVMQKRIVPIYAVRGRTIKPWSLADED